MKIFLVIADLWSIGDLVAKDESLALLYHYDAGEVRGVFDSKEAAEKFRDEMTEAAKEDVEENGCDPIEYVIEEWEVNGQCITGNLK